MIISAFYDTHFFDISSHLLGAKLSKIQQQIIAVLSFCILSTVFGFVSDFCFAIAYCFSPSKKKYIPSH